MKKVSIFAILILTVLMPFDLHAESDKYESSSDVLNKARKELKRTDKENLKAIGKIWFTEPKDGAKVKNPVKVCFETEGLKVVHWGKSNKPKEGHHHLMIDVFLPDMPYWASLKKPLKMIHKSKGESCHTISKTFSPGEHALSGVFTQNNHMPYAPAITTSIKIIVEE